MVMIIDNPKGLLNGENFWFMEPRREKLERMFLADHLWAILTGRDLCGNLGMLEKLQQNSHWIVQGRYILE